jgi:hypothetical protein
MSLLTGKKATPLGNPHLCKSCAWGQFMTGYRDSDRLAICTNTSPNMVVPFAMLECTGFSDKNRPDYDQMKKLAIDIQPGRISSKAAGFSSIESHRPTRKTRGNEYENKTSLLRAKVN